MRVCARWRCAAQSNFSPTSRASSSCTALTASLKQASASSYLEIEHLISYRHLIRPGWILANNCDQFCGNLDLVRQDRKLSKSAAANTYSNSNRYGNSGPARRIDTPKAAEVEQSRYQLDSFEKGADAPHVPNKTLIKLDPFRSCIMFRSLQIALSKKVQNDCWCDSEALTL
eukprot:5358-Prorocentrum_minimum.AAC.4